MNHVETILEKANSICVANGSRLTNKRRQVLSILLQSNVAISAYDVIDQYQATYHETLAPMSAYRILKFLEQEQLAHRINISNKYVACAHIGKDHSHELSHFLFCEKCQRVEELEQKQEHNGQLKTTIEKSGYKLASPQIELSCICSHCHSSLG